MELFAYPFQIGQWQMTNNNEARISLTLDAYFPGMTNKVPSDVVSSLNNITLKVTTIVVSHILITLVL